MPLRPRIRLSARPIAGLILCPLLVFPTGCAHSGRERAPSPLQGKYASGSPRYHVEIDGLGRRHGAERWWHENGTLRSEAAWRAGARDGAYRAWYPDGTPWYAGRDSVGVPVDTLRFWHPNGRLQSLSVFAGGAPVHLEEFDSSGLTPMEALARFEAKRLADSAEASGGIRNRALADWTARVRASVETYWSLPEPLRKTPRRAVARIRVAASGAVLGTTWPEKSGHAEFDRRAALALAKVKRFPPLPPELGAGPLELRYEFLTPGLAPPRRRLRLRDPEKALADSAVNDAVAAGEDAVR